MTDQNEFDRKWVDLITRFTWIKAVYALIGLTRLGEHPTTVQQLAATLGVPEDEAIDLAWRASRVRPDADGRIHLAAPFGGSSGPSRRKVLIGDRELPVSGCAPDLLPAAAVLDVGFRVEDTCQVTGTPIRFEFTPDGVGRVEPPEAVVALVAPEVASTYTDAEIEEINLNLCSQQPFFASPQAAQDWLTAHSGGQLVPIKEVARHPLFAHIREVWRPEILANAAEGASSAGTV